MATGIERVVSPAVFTRETDLSFLPSGISQIGAAFVGGTLRGPAFRPVIVESQEQFQSIFGGTDPEYYVPYAVTEYLREAQRATIVRILGLDGYDSTIYKSAVLSVSGSEGTFPAAIIHPSRTGLTVHSAAASGTPKAFSLTISGSNGSTTYPTVSLFETDENYITKVLGNNPKTKQDGYVYASFPSAVALLSGSSAGSGSVAATSVTTELNFSGSIHGTYSPAHSPVIRSQAFGATKYNLFQFFSLSDGSSANTAVKVSITAIRPDPLGGYGTFGVIVREFDDTDVTMRVLEQFENLTLDPDSVNYFARRIGTARPIIDENNDVYLDGDYPNSSRYIYVVPADGIEAIPPTALPYGFAPLSPPINANNVVAPSYVTTRYYTPQGSVTPIANARTFYGFDFGSTTNQAYVNALPSGSAVKVGITPTLDPDTGFDLLETLVAQDISDVSANTGLSLRKFTVPLQGGFDGQNPAVVRATGANITSTNTQGFDLSDSTKAGAVAYKQALDILGNAEAWDINLLVLPGVIYSQHPYVVQEGIYLCENRGDCFFPLDSDVLGATISSVINVSNSLNTNYAATYYPWVKILDPGSAKNVWVPPSVIIPRAYAFNDRIAAEWFAPAGLIRGALGDVLAVRKRLDLGNRDELYENNINPIAQFPEQGIAIWGQKTLQVQASALDRVNVRRLLINLKKYFASFSRYFVFEPHTDVMQQRFLSIANPYLESVQERSGLYGFNVDLSGNTPDLIDRNIFTAKIALRPTKAVEFIVLDFNILPAGAVFNEVQS